MTTMTHPQTQHFFNLGPETILRAVERLGVRCTGRCLALNSMENRVFEVEIELQEEERSVYDRFRIAKFYRPGRWSREQILEEHTFLFDLVEHELPVVAPFRNEAGESLFEIEEFGIYYSVFPKVGGRMPQELNSEEMERLGRLLARIHNVGAGRDAPNRLRLDATTYGSDNLDFLLSKGIVPKEVQPLYEQAVKSLVQIAGPWFEGISYHRVHGDLHMGNILMTRQGPFIVDLDDMVRGPAVQDLWLVIPSRDEYGLRLLDSFLEGYEQMRLFDPSTLRLIEPLRALRYIHFTAWIARRWEDPSFKAAFPHYGSMGYWKEQIADLQDQLELISSRNVWG